MISYQDEAFIPKDTTIPVVGEAKIKNPIQFGRFVDEEDAVLVSISRRQIEQGNRKKPPSAFTSNPPGPGTRFTSTPARPSVRWSPAAASAPVSTM